VRSGCRIAWLAFFFIHHRNNAWEHFRCNR
jgi:hypothetical protein